MFQNSKNSFVNSNIIFRDIESTLRTFKGSRSKYQIDALCTICMLPFTNHFGSTIGSIESMRADKAS